MGIMHFHLLIIARHSQNDEKVVRARQILAIRMIAKLAHI